MKSIGVVVVGTPSAGKSYFASILKKRIRGVKVLEINDVAKARRLFFKKADADGTKTVRLGELERAINSETKRSGSWVVVGHLGVEMNLGADIAVVIRAHLKELERRMMKRGYGKRKIMDNLVSEAIDYSGSKASGMYKETYEISDKEEMEGMAKYIKERIQGSKKRRRSGQKRYLTELIPYIKKYGNQ